MNPKLLISLLTTLSVALLASGCIFGSTKEDGPFLPGPSQVRELADEISGVDALTIAADGSKMLYVASIDPINDRVYLVVRDARTGRPLQLYQDPPVASANWGPQSGTFAYLTYAEAGQKASIGVMADEALAMNEIVDLMGYDFISTPAWSPDGRFIAFWSRKTMDERTTESTLWMVRPDGSDLKTLYGGLGAKTIGMLLGNVAWSPDNNKLLFTMGKGDTANAYVIERRGGSPKNLTPQYLNVSDLFWSPTGKKIGYAAIDKDQSGRLPRIGIMNSDGSGKGTLGPYGRPVGWIPASGELAYIAFDDAKGATWLSPRLEAIDAKTRAVRVLAEAENANIVAAATSRDSRVFFVTANEQGLGSIMVVE